MKFYISVDMEGIAGILFKEQIYRGEMFYEESRRLLTDEVNAVVEALAQSGATEVVVKDAHGSGFNLLYGSLHPAATLAAGALPLANRFPGLDETFAGALLIGYHAMAGTRDAILEHTFSYADILELALNGEPIGEIGIDALLFGRSGVPVVFVSGDDKTCAEAQRQLGAVFTYETKRATGRHSGLLKAPKRVLAEIGDAVKEAVNRRGACRPYSLPGPYDMRIEYTSTNLADARALESDGVRRVGGRALALRDDNLPRLLARTFS
ncbi:M55 family metallopeptidase [Cohnella rhizosphaerae]|uniref:M55 family metallopeptidase n=1 Tax=Cohnella rhizosphaerae TaxID=1457232 RepID=A0A9X4QSI5_9BACL|nr:M55 family metallopeptidase [Cohnella rhizosphaerae]MDG0810116.1 M55 family metallopeptidase [Cohnella rhizosphaerae]